MRKGRFHWHEMGTALVACVLVAWLAAPALAQKPFLGQLRTAYSLSPQFAKCTICHSFDPAKKERPKKDNLNVFGKELQAEPKMKSALDKKEHDEHKFTPEELAAVAEAIKAIANKDSDDDGATNEEELALGTYPGDKASTPSKEALEQYRKAHPAK